MKKIISAAIVLAIMGTMPVGVSASQNRDYEPIPSMVQYTIDNDGMGSVVNRHNLFNQQNEQVAYCLDCESGYIIYDINSCIIEYSSTAESPYLNCDEVVYYGGPLEYVTEKDGQFFDINSGECVNDFEFEPIESSEYAVQTISTNSNIRDVKTTIKGSTRKLNYNTGDKNACGSLATTIMLYYYYDYVSSDYLKASFANNSMMTFEAIRGVIEPKREGTDYTTLPQGIEKAYKTVTSLNSLSAIPQYTGDYWGRVYYSILRLDEPVIVGLSDHSIYKNHWVVAHGTQIRYNGNTMIYKWYVVNDGWGNENVLINSSYSDGIVYFD
ncbi:hypothetical protein [Ruminococcus sp.]|uniref:hypothetical protein n=1 Tax=Ruminococcus sp. TaxID=41978 RepID=UPI0025DD499A|nr:hypothetical protein [Ruminococcus sp.]